jgi:hypothetical protein
MDEARAATAPEVSPSEELTKIPSKISEKNATATAEGSIYETEKEVGISPLVI